MATTKKMDFDFIQGINLFIAKENPIKKMRNIKRKRKRAMVTFLNEMLFE